MNPFYVLSVLLLIGGAAFGKNNRYPAYACFLVAVLSAFVGTYHV